MTARWDLHASLTCQSIDDSRHHDEPREMDPLSKSRTCGPGLSSCCLERVACTGQIVVSLGGIIKILAAALLVLGTVAVLILLGIVVPTIGFGAM